MNNEQLNNFDMHKKVYALVNGDIPIMTKYSEFGVYIPEYGNTINFVEKTDADYVQSTKGLTAAKHVVLDEIYHGTLPIKSALFSISHKLADEKLKATVSITNSVYQKLREENFLETARIIITAAKANLASLGGFNITQEKLDKLEAKLTLVNQKKGEQGTGFSTRSSLWKALNEGLDKLHEIVTTHLDAIADCTREEDVNFYNKYKAARVVIDRGGSHGGDDDETPPAPPTPPAA